MFRAVPNRPKSFIDILADLIEEDGPGPKDNARRARDPSGYGMAVHLNAAASQDTRDGEVTGIRSVAYREDLRELRALADDEESIATELNLARVHSLSELKQIRRAFAWRNHPDRLHPTVYGHATQRMKIANMLIDRRGKELARTGRLPRPKRP